MVALLFEKAKSAADSVVRLFVDYSQPFSEMIKACGFDWVDDSIITKNFPINRHPNGKVEIKVYHFNRDIGSDEAIREMDKEGYRPVELPEGLAYAKANPDKQRKYPIVILGSVWRNFHGHRFVPYLDSGSGGRDLDLRWFGHGWGSGCRFLAVRK